MKYGSSEEARPDGLMVFTHEDGSQLDSIKKNAPKAEVIEAVALNVAMNVAMNYCRTYSKETRREIEPFLKKINNRLAVINDEDGFEF